MKKIYGLFLLILFLLITFCTAGTNSDRPVRVGIDILAEQHTILKGKKVGLITNQTGLSSKFVSSTDINSQLPDVKLVALFGPEHGFKGGRMGTILEDGKEKDIKVFSLYGNTRRPTPGMLKGIDMLIFDIQDIGARSYTYISTMRYCMEEAAKYDIEFLVLDRPNPLGGLLVDGPLLDKNFESFVGSAPIPYVHGMTIGEIALFINKELNINCKLTVIKMDGWKREMLWEDTGLPWTPTSPHIPE
ncbi:MAG: DUF1343 domain-containing protein, partial [Candidatus Omnitrophica bacterium]|nr:DUF1343 domain-containing protein [Candidatus Omnitrophota bacterium]